MDITLTRFAYLSDATYGVLRAGSLVLATVEDAWVPNPGGPGGLPHGPTFHGSCVPDGTYSLEAHNTDAHPNVWALVNPLLGVYHWSKPLGTPPTWGRIACLIHSGNTSKDVEGCIAVGKAYGSCQDGNLDCVVHSVDALSQLQQLLGKGSHRLIIAPYAGTATALEKPA